MAKDGCWHQNEIPHGYLEQSNLNSSNTRARGVKKRRRKFNYYRQPTLLSKSWRVNFSIDMLKFEQLKSPHNTTTIIHTRFKKILVFVGIHKVGISKFIAINKPSLKAMSAAWMIVVMPIAREKPLTHTTMLFLYIMITRWRLKYVSGKLFLF